MNQNQSFHQEFDALTVAKLLQKQLASGSLTSQEEAFLKQWCAVHDPENTLRDALRLNDEDLLRQVLGDQGDSDESFASKFKTDESLKNVLARISTNGSDSKTVLLRPKSKSKSAARFIWGAAAAVAVVFVVAYGFFYLTTGYYTSNEKDIHVVDLPPGGNRATLVLADGRELSLSETNEAIVVDRGQILYEDGTTLIASDNGLLGGGAEPNTSIAQIVTPMGGSYKIVLSDGTKVWLNAHSRLLYPYEFTEIERVVEVVGEAYFEVAHQRGQDGKLKPFTVKTNGQMVRVLGTSFNISAYEEDSEVRTTLIEGSVQVVNPSNGSAMTLVPGEQSSFKNGKFDKKQVNVALSTAWKDGFFQFERDDIQTVMKQISRWYGVDVIYEGDPIDMRITGKAYRSSNASQVLEILRHLDIPFKIEENAIVVSGKE